MSWLKHEFQERYVIMVIMLNCVHSMLYIVYLNYNVFKFILSFQGLFRQNNEKKTYKELGTRFGWNF